MSQGIEISIDEPFRDTVDRPWVRRIVRQLLKAEGVERPYDVSLVFTDSGTVQHLNREYRGVNEPTDVLAFYMAARKKAADTFVLPPDGVSRLGEVIISYPQAVEQAKEQGHSLERELALLVIHGVLHLLGYDHELARDESKMRGRENELLDRYLRGQ